jgi:hypothetical protein
VRELVRDPGRVTALGEAGRRAAQEHARSRQIERMERLLIDAAATRLGPAARNP